MKGYQAHLHQMYSSKTFERKVEYFKYNFSDILTGINTKRCTVLEIGPGMGESISYLNRLGIKTIDVIDNDRSIIDTIKRKFKIRKAILTNSTRGLANLGRYDLIIIIQVLEHIPVDKQARFLSNAYSHLSQNGTILLVVPNANNPLGLAERYGDYQHRISFTTQSLKDLINESKINNFEFQISGFEIPPYNLVNVARILLQKVLHLLLLIVMIVNGGTYFNVLTPNITLRIKKVS